MTLGKFAGEQVPERPGHWARFWMFTERLPNWLVVAVIAAAIGGTVVGSRLWSPDARATSQCKEWVEGNLRSPGTAEYGDVTATSYDDVRQVFGDVDSENGFGALVRSHFRCIIRDGAVVSGESSIR